MIAVYTVWHFSNFGIKTTVHVCPVESIPFPPVIRKGMAGIAPGFLFFFGWVESKKQQRGGGAPLPPPLYTTPLTTDDDTTLSSSRCHPLPIGSLHSLIFKYCDVVSCLNKGCKSPKDFLTYLNGVLHHPFFI